MSTIETASGIYDSRYPLLDPKAEYVVGFMYSRPFDRVILVRKIKGWQKDLLNGVGGKCESYDVNPFCTMAREFREETGVTDAIDWQSFGRLEGRNSIVHFFKNEVRYFPTINEETDVGEPLEPHSLSDVADRGDVVLNLKWLIPMLIYDSEARFEVDTV